MHRRFLSCVTAVGLCACGQPKQAEDPHAFIEEPGSAGAPQRSPGASPGRVRAAKPAGRAPARGALANARECELAARNAVRVGIDQAIAGAPDEPTRRRLQADRDTALKSEEAAAHVREMRDACLRQGMSRAEASCVAAARDEPGIEACYPE